MRYATRRGRDAADDRIRELVADTPDATVVTSDRVLRHDVEAAGLTVIGAMAYLAQLDAEGRRLPSTLHDAERRFDRSKCRATT